MSSRPFPLGPQKPSHALPLTVHSNGSNGAGPGLRPALKPMNRRAPGGNGDVVTKVMVLPDWVHTTSHQHSGRADNATPSGKTSTSTTGAGRTDAFSKLIED